MLEMRFCQLSEREGREIVPVARFPFKSISIGGASSIFVVRCTGTSSILSILPSGIWLAWQSDLHAAHGAGRTSQRPFAVSRRKVCITISLRFELLGHQRRGVEESKANPQLLEQLNSRGVDE